MMTSEELINDKLRTPAIVFLFHNGMVACCDAEGRQIPPLQGRFSEVVGMVMQHVDANTVFKGWPDIVEDGKLGDWRCR